MQRLFSFVFAISPSLERVSGSTSHILLILAVLRVGCKVQSVCERGAYYYWYWRESGRDVDGGETAEAGPLGCGMLYCRWWMLLLYCHVICLWMYLCVKSDTVLQEK